MFSLRQNQFKVYHVPIALVHTISEKMIQITLVNALNRIIKLSISYLHDAVILLPQPESFTVFVSRANWGFCYLNLTRITKFKYERKSELNSGLGSKKTSLCKWPVHCNVNKFLFTKITARSCL